VSDARQSSRWDNAIEWLKSPTAVIGGLVAVAYFVSRLGQTSFYSKFGLEPDDVGLGRTETLTRSAVWLVLIALVPAALAVFGWAAKRSTVKWVIAAGLVSIVALPIWVPQAYRHDADCVEDGKAVRPAGLSTPLRIITNPLGLRAEPVRVAWINGGSTGYDFGTENVIYLGRADGTAVFFDPRTKQTVRVPQNDVVVRWTSHVPIAKRCR
jgi:hypothetical protein